MLPDTAGHLGGGREGGIVTVDADRRNKPLQEPSATRPYQCRQTGPWPDSPVAPAHPRMTINGLQRPLPLPTPPPHFPLPTCARLAMISASAGSMVVLPMSLRSLRLKCASSSPRRELPICGVRWNQKMLPQPPTPSPSTLTRRPKWMARRPSTLPMDGSPKSSRM